MMTRRLHELKMEGGMTMTKHLDDFDELIVGLQTLGEPLDGARQLIILLRSLPTEYELICSVVENAKNFTLIEVKEKLLKEYERLDTKEGAAEGYSERQQVQGCEVLQGQQGLRFKEERRLQGQVLQLRPDGPHEVRLLGRERR